MLQILGTADKRTRSRHPVATPLSLTVLVGIALLLTPEEAHSEPWRIETVSETSASWTAIAVTPDGTPRIAYATVSGVKSDEYPWGNPSTVSSDNPDLISMDLATDGSPSYAWVNRNPAPIDDYIRVVTPYGVFLGFQCSSQPIVKVDANDVVNLVYAKDSQCGGGLAALIHATRAVGGDWEYHDTNMNYVRYDFHGRVLAMDLGLDDDIAIAAFSGLPGAVKLRYKDLGESGDEIVFDSSHDIEHIALAIDDSNDQPHIVFNDATAGELLYATRTSFDNWTTDLIARSDGDSWWYGSIVVDSGGTPHVAFFNQETGTVRYAKLSGSFWVQQTLETVGTNGGYTSIAIDAYDGIHVSYYDATNARVRYASSLDCNDNNTHDLDEIDAGLLDDCNGNGHPDQCEIDLGFAEDCDFDGVPNDCEPDCDNNGISDDCGGYTDCNLNSIPDVCEEDCNGNGRPDDCDIDSGIYLDCNDNDILDVCEAPFLWEPVFSETHLTNFPDVRESDTDWGDWDADGDLDPLVIGAIDALPYRSSRIYLHEPWGFYDIEAPMQSMRRGSAEWVDFDNDGDLDVSLVGITGCCWDFYTFRNDDGEYAFYDDLGAPEYEPSVTWSDYDNDGDLDALYLVGSLGESFTRIHRNDDGAFINIGAAGLPGLGFGPSVVWGDYDADGDLDVLTSGQEGPSIYGRETAIYRNDGGLFALHDVGLEDVAGTADWADTDADGDLDILVYGGTGFLSSDTFIYRNDGGTFVDLGVDLGFIPDETSFGDYDNDGDLDILYTGRPHPTPPFLYSGVFRNDDGAFIDVDLGLRALQDVDISWSDYDSDGDLDIALSGETTVLAVSELYDSDCSLKNTPPTAPTNLALSIDGTSYTFSWDAATDAETPTPGLTYNLRVGTSPGASDIMAAMSDHITGYRQVPRMGNTTHTRSWTLDIPTPGPIFWGVQAIDGGYAGSPFATDATQPICRVEPRSIAFGHVSGHADSSFTITNTGGGQLTGDVTSTCGDFILLSGGGPFSLGPLESLEVGVRFTPLSAGAHACAINLGVAECATRAYLGDLEGGMKILDVTDPANPQLVSTIPEPTLEMQIVDGVAYLTGDTSTGAFRVAGVFDPTQPYDISSLDVPSYSRDVRVVGTIAYVATSATGKMHIIDVETPAVPVLLGTFNSADAVWRLDVSGNYAYLASETEGLQVVEANDLNDPYPDRLGQYLTPAPAWGVDVVDDVAFVASSDAGLQILDVSTPNPAFIASLAIPGRCDDVHVEGDYAYVAAGDSGLAIVDVSDPMMPALVSRHLTPDWLASVDVFAGYAYLATTEAGLEIVDVHDPTNPLLVGSYDTDGDSRGIQVVGGVELTGYGDAVIAVPEAPAPELALRPGRPNPFAASTTIRLSLDRAADVTVTIYDVTGRRVRRLVDGRLGVGEHTVTWDGRDEAGRDTPDGTYFLQLRDDSRLLTRKVVRVR